jgi:hypothetical protein
MSDDAGLDGNIVVNVMTGASLSKFTVLSVDVEPALPFPNVSVTELAAIEGITVPAAPTEVAVRVHVILSRVDRDQITPAAVPFWIISETAKLEAPTALEKTTV